MAVCVAGVGEGVQKAALPLHVQKLQKALRIDCLVNQVETLFGESLISKDELGYISLYTSHVNDIAMVQKMYA